MKCKVIFLKIFVIILMAPLAWSEPIPPESFVEDVTVRLMRATQPKQIAPQPVTAYLAQLFQEALDLEGLSRGIVGQHKKEVTSEQINLFQSEFEKSLVKLMSTALEEVESYDIKVQEPRNVTAKRAQVPTLISTAKQGKFEIQFSLAAAADSWQIRNLIINGVNLGLTYRNQFKELMKTHNNNVEDVIADWAKVVNEETGA